MDDAKLPPGSPPYGGFDCIFVGGEWRRGKAKPRADHDPFTGEVLIEVGQADAGDLDEAYAAALKAQPQWAATLPMERAAIMSRAADIMRQRKNEIMSWLIRESGSTRLKAGLEWFAVYGGMLEAAALPHMVEGRLPPADLPGKESRVYRKPVGVVGVISPWNWPLQLSNRSVAPALAIGNAVVLKPASDTPITGGLLLGKIFEEAGLPPGVLNIVPGPGKEIGDAFVRHAAPRVISFTGSTEVGRQIGRLAAEADRIKRVELELGGNSPLIVLADADLDAAVEAAVWGKFLHQGQICMIANRLIVERKIHDRFLEQFRERVRTLKVGNPDNPDTFIGPIINRSQFDSLQKKIEAARQSGAREVLGGAAQGFVLPPHIFAEVTNDNPLAREEIFGPVAPVIRAESEDDAIRLANDTDRGLSAAIFTADPDRGARLAAKIESGMVHVNDQPVNDLPFNPFGGEKNSGIGRFNGRWAIDAFTTDQWITIQRGRRSLPFTARDAQQLTAAAAGG